MTRLDACGGQTPEDTRKLYQTRLTSRGTVRPVIDWKRKLGSRKFWALLAGVVTSVLVLAGAGEDTIVKVTALITSVGAVIAYMLAEAHVDGKNGNGNGNGYGNGYGNGFGNGDGNGFGNGTGSARDNGKDGKRSNKP